LSSPDLFEKKVGIKRINMKGVSDWLKNVTEIDHKIKFPALLKKGWKENNNLYCTSL